MANGSTTMLNGLTPSGNQMSSGFDRALISFLSGVTTFLLSKHWIDETTAMFISLTVVPFIAFAWGMWSGRQIAVVSRASYIPDTTIVTTKELADATPMVNNIISKDTTKVVDSVTNRTIDTSPTK